jgi:hypothetical protein
MDKVEYELRFSFFLGVTHYRMNDSAGIGDVMVKTGWLK